MRGVGGTEDVTAMAAVMASEEETERRATGGRVTATGSRVGLYHVSEDPSNTVGGPWRRE
jgi:hypothetical protein